MMEYLAWMRKKKGGQVTWQDVADLLEQIKRGPYDPSEALRMRWIDETSSQVTFDDITLKHREQLLAGVNHKT